MVVCFFAVCLFIPPYIYLEFGLELELVLRGWAEIT